MLQLADARPHREDFSLGRGHFGVYAFRLCLET